MEYQFYPRWWKYGRPADFWLKNSSMLKETIEKFKLKPVAKEFLVSEELVSPMGGLPGEGRPIPIPKPWPFPGGIRIPHLHYEKDVYLLNDEQWKSFAGGIIVDLREKLSKVNTVNFEQFIEFAEAAENLM